MAQIHNVFEFCCIAEGAEFPFPVKIPLGSKIPWVKEIIYEKERNGVFKDTDANKLQLYKLKIPVSLAQWDSTQTSQRAGTIEADNLEPVISQSSQTIQEVLGKTQPFQSEDIYILVRTPPILPVPSTPQVPVPSTPQVPVPSTPQVPVPSTPQVPVPSTPQVPERNSILAEQSPIKVVTFEEVQECLNEMDLTTKMLACATGAKTLPLWTSETYPHLNIPCLTAEMQPELLLHELGQSPHQDELLEDRLRQLFHNHLTLCLNTTGSGKTRLIFEGLCRMQWGLYVICGRRQGEDPIGSNDMTATVQSLVRRHGFSAKITNKGPEHEQNNTIAQRSILAVYVARLTLFREFLRAASKPASSPEDLDSSSMRLRWLHAQLAPHWFFDCDPSLKLAVLFSRDSEENLLRQLQVLWKAVDQFIGKESFVTVLDEVQVVADCLPNAFLSSDRELQYRPLLQQVILPITRSEMIRPLGGKVILCGTAVNRVTIHDVAASSGGKPIQFGEVKDIGAFNHPEAQEKYFSKYLFPGNDSLEKLAHLQLAWRHLRGRYRISASFIQVALLNPHLPFELLLQDHVQDLTARGLPLDDTEFTSNIGPSNEDSLNTIPILKGRIGRRALPIFTRGAFNKIKTDHHMRQNLLRFLTIYVMTGQVLYTNSDLEEFVEYGIARWSPDSDRYSVIDEPVAILAIEAALGPFKDDIPRGIREQWRSAFHPSAKGFVYENIVAYQIYRALRGTGCRLDNIFDIKSAAKPKWASWNIKLRSVTPSGERSDVEINSPIRVICFNADTGDDMISWLRDPGGVAIATPDNLFGTDIFALCNVYNTKKGRKKQKKRTARSTSRQSPSNFDILVWIQCKVGLNFTNKDAVLSMRPDLLYMKNRSNDPQQYSNDLRPEVFRLLLKLGFDALDTERNLLVLASPKDKKIQADDLPLENYYLATLKEMELFKEDLTYGLKRRLRVDEHDKPGKRAK